MAVLLAVLAAGVLLAGLIGVVIAADDLDRSLRYLQQGDTMPYCARCTAPIRFVRTRLGKAMPCDPHPDSSGTVAAYEVLPGRFTDAYVVTPVTPALPGYTRFVPHFATCDDRPPRPAKPGPTQDPLIEE